MNKAVYARGALLVGAAFAGLVAGVGAHAQAASGPREDQNATDNGNSAADLTTGSEIVVTAQRRSEALSKVPISVSAFSQRELESRGAKEFADVVRLTPGLSLQKSDIGGNQVSIRGIASGAGAATTGIYIDDAPIQARNIGYSPSTAFPALFDVDRVEVLRGPQGTLFGAGSEGGTIRFIQAQPSLTKFSYRARAELATTESGAASYEAGLALGGPILTDRIGFRVSGYYRRNGGWMDDIDGTFTVLDPTAASYEKAISVNKTGTAIKNANWDTAFLLHGALVIAPTSKLKLTASVTYQNLHNNDASNSFWLAASDASNSHYQRLFFRAGNPATNPALTALTGPDNAPGGDRFVLPALRAEWDMGFATLTSNTSYFDRAEHQRADYTRYYLRYLASQLVPAPGFKAVSDFTNNQKNFVQELRLQSNDSASALNWVLGAFYSHSVQTDTQPIAENFSANLPAIVFGGVPFGVTDGEPFGPGTSAFLNTFGTPLLPGSVSYNENRHVVEKQIAGFAQVDWRPFEHLKLTGGVRVSRNLLDLDILLLGPESNINAPYGTPCFVYGAPCVLGQGALTPAYPSTSVSTKETSVTPKFGVTYEPDQRNLFYATVAKGFRPGGAGAIIPPYVCDSDLQRLGYSSAPATFKSDTVWSYEVGSKNRLFGGLVALNGSAYIIKWSNIQTNYGLPSCGYSFVDNGGDATAKGFDLGVELTPTRSLTLTGAFGYNKTTFDADVLSGTNVIFPGGSGVPGASSPWNVSLSGAYNFTAAKTPFYARLDYTYQSRERRAGSTEPGAFSYNSLDRPNPPYSVVNARIGAYINRLDVSLFVSNLTNAHPYLAIGSNSLIPRDPVWIATTLRPRTVGITVALK